MIIVLPGTYFPHISISGKTENGKAQNQVNATINPACDPFSLPSIGHDMVLADHRKISLNCYPNIDVQKTSNIVSGVG